MKTYADMVADYKKRQRDTVVDTIAAGLTYMDEMVVDAGLLAEADILSELTESACSALPFVLIAVQEGSKVILGRKPGVTGVKDGAYRMAKTSVAMGIGGAVATAAGFWAALPVTMGVRALFDRYRSRALTGHRVQSRIQRLRELRQTMQPETVQEAPTETIESTSYLPETV